LVQNHLLEFLVEPGTTDVVIQVVDHLPIHIGFEYDNHGSRFIKEQRYAVTLEHNNVLGFDDRFYGKFQMAQQELLLLSQIRYTFPIGKKWEIGAHYSGSRTRLAKDFEDLETLAKSQVIGVLGSYRIIEDNDMELKLNWGFDHKRFIDEQLGVEVSRDDLRVVNAGLDLDISDPFGRTIITGAANVGLVDILKASPAKNPNSSRSAAGAGGKFSKGVFNLFRLQPMPWQTAILWKNSAQLSNHDLVSSEQFQIGGAQSVRAYAPAEYAGDKGWYTAIDWSIPFYFLPKEANVPFYDDVTFYDSLRFVAFWDWAFADTKTPAANDKERHTIKGYGFGVRFNVKDDIEARVEVGIPIGKRSSDGSHAHPWFELNLKF